MLASGNPFSRRDVAITLAAAALGYLRWTQLVPMLVAWSFLLAMLGGIALVSYQEQIFPLLAELDDAYIELAGDDAAGQPQGNGSAVNRAAKPPTATGEGAVEWDGADLEGWIWRAWAVASLLGWLLGGIWRYLFGPSDPWPLRRKLWICAVLAGACSLGLLGIWAWGPETFNGSAASWIALFVGVPVAVWLVSVWGLSVSHLLGQFAAHLQAADEADARQAS